MKIIRSGLSGFVLKMPEKRILLIKREKMPYKGLFCFPGGHHEFGESIDEGIVRETYEETGFVVKPFEKSHMPYVTERVYPELDTHWIIHTKIFEIIDQKPCLEGIEYEFFNTMNCDIGKSEFRHLKELGNEELIPHFWRVYNYLNSYVA